MATLSDDEELRSRAEALVEANKDVLDDQIAFRGAQWDAGLAIVSFPEGRGGHGLAPAKQAVVDDVLRANGVELRGPRGSTPSASAWPSRRC